MGEPFMGGFGRRRSADRPLNWRSNRGDENAGSSYFQSRPYQRRGASNSTVRELDGSRGGRPFSRRPNFRDGNSDFHYGRSLGLTFLENLLTNDTEKIILILLKERAGFQKLLETELTADAIVLIVKILRKVCDSAFNDTKHTVLQSTLNEIFINKMKTFIACLPTQDAYQRSSSKHFWKDPDVFFCNLLGVCENVFHIMPTFACKSFPNLLKALKVYFPIIELEHEIEVSKDLKSKGEKLLEIMEIYIKENKEQVSNAEKRTKKGEEEPPDDFRQISVYPSAEEIVCGRGFLRENVVKGPYQSVQHYLDVQFRLLREDFVGPLRDGIANYRSNTPSSHLDTVKVHKGIQFLNREIINEYCCFRVQFRTSNKRKYNYEHSKKFMFGSLLCFTRDDFQNLIFGKVAQRKIEDLDKGQLIVAFDEVHDVDLSALYLMVECSVYFEPYYHVLNVLKSMTEENFPLERYIIRVNAAVQPPEYLTTPELAYKIQEHEFNPLLDWPEETFYNLNESQLVAFKAAVTQEISVIQGPPGTGKTYLGLKVAQTLLENKSAWYNDTPMLVICFTNHALDQFLEGLIPFTKNIVRVGGQSKNSNLDKYNLRNVAEINYDLLRERRHVQDTLEEIKHSTIQIEEIEYYNCIYYCKYFSGIILNYDETWFHEATRQEILEWLLEGGTCAEALSKIQNDLEMLEVQNELNNIGLNESETGDLGYGGPSPHFLKFKADRQGYHLTSLKSMRTHIQQLENELFTLYSVQKPSLAQLIQKGNTSLELTKTKQFYDYLKFQLMQGRRQEVIAPEYFNLQNPYAIHFEDRWKLYFYWLNLYKESLSRRLKDVCAEFPRIYKEYEEMKAITDVRVMKDALVVGMTTTSAARLRSSLQTLKNPIVIVEEAAEVLEAHIVTSVTKHCRHLILIGDHKQLKPNTANFTMDKHYKLGISLFERMLINNIHCYTLNVQHRMRPEISCLIKPAIYDFLEDHPSVNLRPPVIGVEKFIFFIDHKYPEESDDNSSKINHHEVSFLINLARHLVLNGHNPENITILSAYLGQFFAFKREQKSHLDLLEDVRIAVLDNYQGEESDIVLLSLVRNNDENKIGFLSIENRVCVALSRARNGLYIMGNMEQLCCDNKLWRTIKNSLLEQSAVGPELALRCQIHQDQVTSVSVSTDFFSISEGGCKKKCESSLKCGHTCTSMCHVRDRSHSVYRCQAPCLKNLCKSDAGHVCKKMCFEDCGPCTYLVQRNLSCGHEINLECNIDPDFYKCQVLLSTKLPCGHTTDKPCHSDPERFKCPFICDIKVEPCGHACEQFCHVRTDPDHTEYKCQKPCTKFMVGCTIEEEDHRCKKKCFEKCDPCTITVRKQRTVCSHWYDVPCPADVDEMVCDKPCTRLLECGHGCERKCSERCTLRPCAVVVHKVLPECGHSVKLRCSQEPNRKMCRQKCPLKLACGHPCVSQCFEPCRCDAMVDCSGKLAECGHLVTKIDCSLSNLDVDAKLLIKYCDEPCQTILKCGHKCSGSCSQCSQGRIHKRCDKKCGAILVCEHQCDFPCRQACRPCKRKCAYRCQHSQCGKLCGEVCTPCREHCPRNCIHQRCKKYCGEICSVPPCREPCRKYLKCRHPCIGFCGDPCPPKCLVCDKEELLYPLFGTESEDSRFVVLRDCNHVVEDEGMEIWLQQNEDQISYKLCPWCKEAIKTTQRYSDYIKKAIIDVAKVKVKANGKPEELLKRRNDIQACMLILKLKYRNFIYCPKVGHLLKLIEMRMAHGRKKVPINIYELQSIKSKLQIMAHILETCSRIGSFSLDEIFFPQVNFLIDVLSRDINYISDQEIDDLDAEIDRLSRMVEFSRFKKTSPHNEDAKSMIVEIDQKVFATKQFTKEDDECLIQLLKKLNTICPTGIAISESEKREVLKAMGFSKGHWFKCPNGHVYAIGECGRAMEESTCNECGARIGGGQHHLLQDNSVATEMDGAVHGAWSEQANLANYVLN